MIGVLSVSCTSSKVFLTSLFIFPKLFYISFVSEVFVLEDLGISCKTVQMTWLERLGPICLKTLACDTCYISLESWDGCLSVVVFCMYCKCGALLGSQTRLDPWTCEQFCRPLYSRSQSSFSMEVQMNTRSGQLDCMYTRWKRKLEDSREGKCEFGCRTMGTAHHAFVDCPIFKELWDETQRKLSEHQEVSICQ